MIKQIRWREYGILIYRIFLAYVFYFISRVLFYTFNSDIIEVESVKEFLKLSYHGLAFDTTAILYVNLLFILLSIIPAVINATKGYQRIVFYVYFITNIIGYSLNFIDMAYYPFSKSRLTMAVKGVVENEQNYTNLLFSFVKDYWYLPVIFIVLVFIWIKLYKLVKVTHEPIVNKMRYFGLSALGIVFFTLLVVGGIRGGDFKTSTRPINLVDASRHVRTLSQADLVLNSTFSFIRTFEPKNTFKLNQWVSQEVIEKRIVPIKQYDRNVENHPNIVIFIIESFGREYWGSMNKDTKILNFKTHTPFLDSLSTTSYVFDNAYANGRQSIHGMASILSGIPSFETAFTSSPYSKQPIESIVSITNDLGYETSFFHGAENGSMGFLGFGNILGFKNYYGRAEYNNDADYDGIWGIWDEPFLQFMSKTITQSQKPFMATVFTLSSHHPFQVPEKYKKKFLEGDIPIHNCVEYTDYAIAQFFKEAKKQDWYNNTIFVFTADHTNQIYYDEYKKEINKFAVPIMFFSPNPNLVPAGRSSDIVQQIDIYPSLVDLIGYNKPFRSWGRSLFSDKPEVSRAINSTGSGIYQLIQGNYIYTFNGDKIIGVFDIEDKNLSNNLIEKIDSDEVRQGKEDMLAFVQDYRDRIVNKKLK